MGTTVSKLHVKNPEWEPNYAHAKLEKTLKYFEKAASEAIKHFC
jgi:hypothetical protein